MKKNVLIVEENFLAIIGMRHIITKNYPSFIIDTTQNFEEARQMLLRKQYDFLFLDVDLPDTIQDKVVSMIKSFQNSVVILISSYFTDSSSLKHINDGAQAFLHKKSNEETILKSIADLMEKGYYYPSEIIHLINFKNSAPKRLKSLTARESEVFKYLSKGRTNNYIAQNLKIKSTTVSTFKKRILEKLMVKNIVQLVQLYKEYL